MNPGMAAARRTSCSAAKRSTPTTGGDTRKSLGLTGEPGGSRARMTAFKASSGRIRRSARHALFCGTRVAAKSLFDHLESGYTVDYFLEQFPSLTREQVQALLEESKSKAELEAVAVNQLR